MSNTLFTSILATALSLTSVAAAATPADNEARDQAPQTKARIEDGQARYWSHPRLGLVKVDAAGRMLTGRSVTDTAAQTAAPAPSGPTSTRMP